MEDIEYYQIPIYNFSYDLEDEDEEIIKENRELRSMLPFAIVGSDEEIVENGEPIRVRQYPWGRVESKIPPSRRTVLHPLTPGAC